MWTGRFAYPYLYPGVAAGAWYGWGYPYVYAPGYLPYSYPLYGYPWSPAYAPATGAMRLDVSPKDAAVYVDGAYAGIVADFEGAFRHLTLSAGPHAIQVRKEGLETLDVQVNVQPNRTLTYRASMEAAHPGATATPAEPGATPVPPTGVASPAWPGWPGDVRLEVTPKDAQIYVDGYYVGMGRDFEGRRQRLSLTPGTHHIELEARGYERAGADVTVEPGRATTYRGALVKP